MINNDIGLYVHIPFCQQKCSYCDFAAYQNIERYQEAYIASLLLEIANYGKQYKGSKLDTIYFGGGTPTHLTINQLTSIMQEIEKYFDISTCRELSIESNPGEVGLDYFKELQYLGFNRISFGVQTLDNDLLQFLRRTHKAADVYNTLAMVDKVGFEHSNVDIIYGLPNQSVHDVNNTLRLLENDVIDHVSIYGLQLERATQLYALYTQGKIELPSDSIRDEMHDLLLNKCTKAGFEHYEISNFAKNKAYGQHNLRYWQYKEYIGVGAGAHGFLGNKRYGNTPYVVPYINKINKNKSPIIDNEQISLERHIEDYCFLNLRTKWGINIIDFRNTFNIDLYEKYDNIIAKLINTGLLYKNNDNIILTIKGIKYGNYVFEQFIK